MSRLARSAVMSGPRPVSSTPSTTQDWPSVVASSTVPQATSTSTTASVSNEPVRTGNGVPPPPGPHTPDGRSPIPPNPPVRIPAARRPSVPETIRPPSISSDVFVKMSPRPMPTRISGQNVHHRSSTAGSRMPVWTASGTPPATTKNTPQPARSRWIRTAARYLAGRARGDPVIGRGAIRPTALC